MTTLHPGTTYGLVHEWETEEQSSNEVTGKQVEAAKVLWLCP